MKRLFFTLLLVLAVSIAGHAQTQVQKFDVILKNNGDEMVGHVTEIGDTDVKFTYKGETLSYTIKKQDIFRITFSSGRIEVINPSKTKSDETTQAAFDAHNKVAILPFSLIVDNNPGSEELAYKIQADCYSLMTAKRAALIYQDPTTTNAILLRNNITRENYRSHTMDELCHILGVEYVVQGTVTISKGEVYSSTTANTTVRSKPGDKPVPVPVKPGTKVIYPGGTGKATTTASTTTTQKYQTDITLNIFDEHGSKIYEKEHLSFWATPDAYKSTLEYLAKRTPLYGR